MRTLTRLLLSCALPGLVACSAPPATPVAGPAAVAGPTPAATAIESLEEGYVNFCSGCHQYDGRGVPGTYPPLAGSAIVTVDPSTLARLVLDGGFPNQTMPRFREVMSDEAAAAILTYIRSAWGNKAGAVTAADVAASRSP